MRTVADIMTKEVVTVTDATTVREMAEIFEKHRFGSLPIVNAAGAMTGIVTASDLIEQGRPLHMPTVISIFDWVIPLGGEQSVERDLKRISAQTAGELKSTDVITVTASAPVSTAAELMSGHKLHSLPVVDETGHLVGIVARIDIIRSLNS